MGQGADAGAAAERAWRIAMVAVFVVALGAWLQVPFGDFQYDDRGGVASASGAPSAGFRPLLHASFRLDQRLQGSAAAGFLRTNLAIHLAAVMAMMALARRRGREALGCAAAALAFALQPAQAEAVAYVSGRSSSLMTLLLLLGLLAHDRAVSAPTPRARRTWLAAALAAFAAAVATKEVALVFPLLVVVWDGTLGAARRRAAVRLWLAETAGALALAATALAGSHLRSLIAFSASTLSPARSLVANLVAWPRLVSLWWRPGALSIEHQTPAVTAGAAALGGALLLAAIAAGIALARRRSELALALLWVPAALAPTNSLVWKLDPISERSLYLAWVGPALALGAGAEWVRRRLAGRPRLRFATAAVALAAALGAGAALERRLALWHDARALWRDATLKAPRSPRAWNNLGMSHWERDEPRQARAAFRRALTLAPGDVTATRNLIALSLEPDAPTAGARGDDP